MTEAAKKTAAEHAEQLKNAAPAFELLTGGETLPPDVDGEQMPDAAEVAGVILAEGQCTATRYQQGQHLQCELEADHAGYHADGTRGWRGDRRPEPVDGD